MRRVSSIVGAGPGPMCGPLFFRSRGNIARARAAADGGFLQPGGRGCVESDRVGGVLQLDELDRDLDQEPVVLSEVEAGQLHDPAQPLAQRVRMHVEGVGGRAYVAAASQELL